MNGRIQYYIVLCGILSSFLLYYLAYFVPMADSSKIIDYGQATGSPMLQLYKDAMHKDKNKVPHDYTAGWSDDITRFVVTLCKNDTRNKSDMKFDIHVPVDNVVIHVVHREGNLLELEHNASTGAHNIIHTVPVNSFMMVCRIKIQCTEELRKVGECAINDKGYWELSLRVGQFSKFASMLAGESDEEYIVVLTYVLPAFLMSGGKIVMDMQDKMRNDVKLTKWSPNMNVDKEEVGWHTKETCTINKMAEHIQTVDAVRNTLFCKIETGVDRALSVYKVWAKAKGDSRSAEILRNYCEGQLQEPPAWWPQRLVDVRMNALVPGVNAWYFRGSFNALSYTWDTDSNKLHENTRPFSSSRTVSTYRKNAYDDLLETVKDVDTSEYLWIDALCIDQTNEEEKISEVKRSPEYYKKCNKCIVFPSGLSQDTDIAELSGPTLPRWFHRAWTLQEAASAEFIVGRFSANGSVSYLDRFEIVEYLDNNTQQSGVLISSARQIMRRAGLDMLHPATIVEWALARKAGRVQDVVYGTASMFKENVDGEIVGNYNTCMRCVIIKLAQALCGKDRTSLVTLTGDGWLPKLIREEELAGITAESELDSDVLDDGSLLIKDTVLINVGNVTLHRKMLHIGDNYRRYSQSRSKKFYIEELAAKCSRPRNDKKYAGDNAAIRAWVATTYMSSDILKISCDKDTKVMRVIALNDIGFSHLIFVGYARESIYLERVYICAKLGDNRIFYKRGILAEPVGEIINDNKDKTDVVLAEGSSCSCCVCKVPSTL